MSFDTLDPETLVPVLSAIIPPSGVAVVNPSINDKNTPDFVEPVVK